MADAIRTNAASPVLSPSVLSSSVAPIVALASPTPLRIVTQDIPNLLPWTQDDKVTAIANTALTIAGSALTANDTDPDHDKLTVVTVGSATHGTVALSGNDTIVFTPEAGFTGTASFTYLAADGRGGDATGVVKVTVNAPPNTAPTVSDPAQSLFALPGTPVALKVSASDANGDPLTFSAGDPPQGSVTGGSGGAFVYTPDTGASGWDSFVVTVSDGHGAAATQTINMQLVAIPAPDGWVMFAEDGWVGEIGGNGQVFGSAGYQEVAVLDVPGLVQFDASFNAGGDLVCPKGNAAHWSVVQQGSNALFSDGDTFVTIPVGTTGMAVFFEDGPRLLVIEGGVMKIGGQVIDGTLRQVTAAPDGTAHPTGADADAIGRLFLSEGAEAWIGGDIDLFGTNGSEKLWIYSGDIQLDPSFARGGDQVFMAAGVRTTEASATGAGVHLSGGDVNLDITAGTAGTSLGFWDANKILVLDPANGSVSIGDQVLTSTPSPLTFA